MMKATKPVTTSESSRRRIVAAARTHFFAHGFRGVSMDDLASELGMSKKTLYAHFAGKTDLLHAVLDDKFNGIELQLQQIAPESPGTFLNTLHDLLSVVQREAAEIQPAFVRDMRREAPEVFQVIEKRRKSLLQKQFGKVFLQGRKAGMVRTDVPVSLIVEMLLAATQAIMNPPKMTELGLTPKTGFTAIISVVLDGVLTGKGRSRL